MIILQLLQRPVVRAALAYVPAVLVARLDFVFVPSAGVRIA